MPVSPDDTVLRVGMVGPVPPPNGGMALQTAQLLRLLHSEQVQTEFVPTNAPYSPHFLSKARGLRAVIRLIPYMRRVWRLAGRTQVIHLMANSGWSWHLFAAPVLLLAPLRGVPVIVNYRGGEARSFFRQGFRWVNLTLRRASRVIVPSAYLREVFHEFGVETEIIPNIVDRDLFHPGTPVSKQEGPLIFVITRNLEKIYGIDTAIRAIALLSDEAAPISLEIAGSGPEDSALRDLAKTLGVSERVHFLGRLERAEITRLYQRASAMLNPTTVDNMPNSVLEALACGVPVISSNVGGVPFIVEHERTALLVPPGDSEALAGAMKRLIDDPMQRMAMSKAGIASIERYTWDAVGPRWMSTYREVAAA